MRWLISRDGQRPWLRMTQPSAWMVGSLTRNQHLSTQVTEGANERKMTSKRVRAKSLQSCPTLCNPMGSLVSMGFSRQEYWSGLPCPPPGDLCDPGIEPKSPVSPALQTFFTAEPTGRDVGYESVGELQAQG